MRSAKLPLVAIANVAGNFTLPDPAHFAPAVPRGLAVPDVMGSGWYSLAVGSSGMATLRVRVRWVQLQPGRRLLLQGPCKAPVQPEHTYPVCLL